MTFPGNCRYVLTHDYVDRNFTLMMQLANGQPKALILEDKSGNVIELKDNGQVRSPYPYFELLIWLVENKGYILFEWQDLKKIENEIYYIRSHIKDMYKMTTQL